MIRLYAVSRSYRDGEREVHALKPLSLAVPEGQSVALLGKSGAGKSTLLHLIGGLEWPSRGQVWVGGSRLDTLGDAGLTDFRLRRVGFIFQFFQLLPALTVRENLLLPLDLAGRPRALARRRAAELLHAVGLEERGESFPDRLSGGEQQRVAIARALVLEPPLLLADEPTGNLDSETGRQVLGLLWNLSREHGTTLLIATHSEEVARQAARRLELRDGSIVADSLPSLLPQLGEGEGVPR